MLSLERVKSVLNGEKTDLGSRHKKALSDYYGMSIHIDGILPSFVNASGFRVHPDVRVNEEYQSIFDNFLFSRHPREKQEQRWWRYSTYRPLQKDPFLRAINVINASIFQDTGYSLTVENKDDEDYLWGMSSGRDTSFFSRFISQTKNIFTDADGFITVIPPTSWSERKSKKVEPVLKFIHTKDIRFISDDEIVFEESDYAWLINKVGYYRFAKNKDGMYVLADENGYYAHLLGIIPAVRAGGYPSYGGYESWLSGAKAVADEYVGSKSSQQLVDKEASHPFITAAAEDCPSCSGIGTITKCSTCSNDMQDCSCNVENGGFIRPNLVACTSCGGSGRQSRNPGDWLIVPKEDMEGSDLIKIITPNVSVNTHLKSTAEQVFSSILDALHLSDISGDSGIAKTKHLETRYQFISAICNDWFDRLIPTLINITLSLRNAKVVDGVIVPFVPNYTLIKPTQFNIKTASDLLIEYQISVQSGMPQYIRNRQLEDYVDKHFGGDNVMAKTVRVINEIDLFSCDTHSELSPIIGTPEWYYHKQLPSIIKKVIRLKGDEWFIKNEIDDIKKEIDKFVIQTFDSNIKINNQNLKNGTEESNTENEIAPIYGSGNQATRAGKSPTGTGFYNQDEQG